MISCHGLEVPITEIGALMEQLQEKSILKINAGPYICVAAFTSLDI